MEIRNSNSNINNERNIRNILDEMNSIFESVGSLTDEYITRPVSSFTDEYISQPACICTNRR